MRSSILKLTGLIALMLVICIPSFGGTLYDNLGAQVVGTSGTLAGSAMLAQRFSVSNDNVDYTFSFNFGGWVTSYGTASLMQLLWDDTNNDISATLALFNGPGDPGLPTVSIWSDTFNPDIFGDGSGFSQSQPGEPRVGLEIDPAFLALGTLPDTLTNVNFTGNFALTPGASYWMVLTSPGVGDDLTLGVDTQWAYTGAPEPVTLAMVGGALVLLCLRRKRQK